MDFHSLFNGIVRSKALVRPRLMDDSCYQAIGNQLRASTLSALQPIGRTQKKPLRGSGFTYSCQASLKAFLFLCFLHGVCAL